MARYYEEEPCEHGKVESHPLHLLPDYRVFPRCPGGVRRELEGVGVIEPIEDGLYKLKAGRYLLIPLSGDTE